MRKNVFDWFWGEFFHWVKFLRANEIFSYSVVQLSKSPPHLKFMKRTPQKKYDSPVRIDKEGEYDGISEKDINYEYDSILTTIGLNKVSRDKELAKKKSVK